MVKANEHPRYGRFFKMLKMGVPLGSVLQKMGAEEPDLDPSVVEANQEAPDALIEL